MFKKKTTTTKPSVFLCSSRALWKRAWGTSGDRWLLLAYVDIGFKLLILGVGDICLSTPFALHQSSQDIFLWAFGPSLGVVVSTFSLCWFCLTPSSVLPCDLQTLAVMMLAIFCDLAESSRPLGRPGPISQRKVAGGQILYSCLAELIRPTSFLFSPPPPVPFCLVWPWSLMTRLLFLPNQSIS